MPSLGFYHAGVPMPSTAAIAAQRTTEYGGNTGLDQMNAATMYAAGGTGAGIKVAVIDSGLDTTHPEFAGRIDPASIDINTMGAISDLAGHGTRVAGVIGAAKDGTTMHGVAYNSTILAIKASSSCGTPPCGLPEANVIAAVDYAIAQGADVINMSFGADGTHSQAYRDALRRAAQAGIVMVAAAGNTGGANPINPAGYAGEEFLAGYMISAISLEADNSISSFSNRCGTSKDWCLGALGSNVQTTDTGGGYTLASGTSYATPHISGAIATMMSLFPTLTPAQVVQILLMTATDLGDPNVFGHGLVNLAAAIQPIGLQSIPLSSGSTASVSSTSMSLGAAFGDALSQSAALENVAFVDEFGRAYTVDLNNRVSRPARRIPFDDVIGRETRRNYSVSASNALGLRMSIAEDESWVEDDYSVSPRFREAGTDDSRFDDESVSMTFRASETAEVVYGHNVGAANLRGGLRGGIDDGDLFLASSEILAPNQTLTGSGEALALRKSISEDTVVTVGAFVSEGSDDEMSDVGRGSLVEVTVGHQVAESLRVDGTLGVLEEEGALLGGDTAGAFGDNGAVTRFGTLSASYTLQRGLEAFGSFTMGRTSVTGVSDSLIQDWSAVQSSAFGIGLRGAGLFTRRDRWGFVVGQPLRVDSADAELSVPVSVAGSVAYVTEEVDVVPTGREIGLQLAYERELLEATSINAWLLGRLEPGHDADRGNDIGVGVTFETAL